MAYWSRWSIIGLLADGPAPANFVKFATKASFSPTGRYPKCAARRATPLLPFPLLFSILFHHFFNPTESFPTHVCLYPLVWAIGKID